MGHVFIVHGDLRKLYCDAWLLPCDEDARPHPHWLGVAAGHGIVGGASDAAGCVASRRTAIDPTAGLAGRCTAAVVDERRVGSTTRSGLVHSRGGAVHRRGYTGGEGASDAAGAAVAAEDGFVDALQFRKRELGGQQLKADRRVFELVTQTLQRIGQDAIVIEHERRQRRHGKKARFIGIAARLQRPLIGCDQGEVSDGDDASARIAVRLAEGVIP